MFLFLHKECPLAINEVPCLSRAQRAFLLAFRRWLLFEFSKAGFSNCAIALTIKLHCLDWKFFLQVTAFSSMDDMLQKAHLVIEGTFIYLRDSTEFFIRVRDGWKKLQVMLNFF